MCLYFQNSTDSPSLRQPIGSNSNNISVLSTKIHPGKVYIFTLTVNKAGRRPVSVNQTVSIIHYAILIFSHLNLESFEFDGYIHLL